MADHRKPEIDPAEGAGSNVPGLFFAFVIAATLTLGAWYILSAAGSLA